MPQTRATRTAATLSPAPRSTKLSQHARIVSPLPRPIRLPNHTTLPPPTLMPHSTRILQNPTNQYSAHPMTSTSTPIHAGNLVGTALTKRSSRPASPPQNPAAWKRTSSPIAEAYADLVGKGANIAEVMEGRQARDRTSLGQYNDASKHRTQYYEDQFRYKDGEVGTIRERVQRESPVIAELKTNVIVRCACMRALSARRTKH